MTPTKCARCDTIITAWRHRHGKSVCLPCLLAIRSASGKRRTANQTPDIGATKVRKFRQATYRMVYQPTHPNSPESGWLMEHRLVMEAAIGRHLDPAEVVHHIDHDTLNNALSNLMLCESRGKHLVEHHLRDAVQARMLSMPSCTACGAATLHGRTVCSACSRGSAACPTCGRSERKMATLTMCNGCYKAHRVAKRAT